MKTIKPAIIFFILHKMFESIKMNEIEDRFKDKAVISHGLVLFSKENALSIIEYCRRNRISILGIDGFFIFGKKIQPIWKIV